MTPEDIERMLPFVQPHYRDNVRVQILAAIREAEERVRRETRRESVMLWDMEAGIIPIHIRGGDVVVRIAGVPFDLTPAEANKIANVIIALAVDQQ